MGLVFRTAAEANRSFPLRRWALGIDWHVHVEPTRACAEARNQLVCGPCWTAHHARAHIAGSGGGQRPRSEQSARHHCVSGSSAPRQPHVARGSDPRRRWRLGWWRWQRWRVGRRPRSNDTRKHCLRPRRRERECRRQREDKRGCQCEWHRQGRLRWKGIHDQHDASGKRQQQRFVT